MAFPLAPLRHQHSLCAYRSARIPCSPCPKQAHSPAPGQHPLSNQLQSPPSKLALDCKVPTYGSARLDGHATSSTLPQPLPTEYRPDFHHPDAPSGITNTYTSIFIDTHALCLSPLLATPLLEFC